MAMGSGKLILSLFPGIGLFDRGFEAVGFCVVRGPDTLWGGDIRRFHAPAGHFTGIIGGPPCQNFSTVNRRRDTAAGLLLVNEYLRVVMEAHPEWWLMENVAGSPNVTVSGFVTQRFTLNASHVGSAQHRLRKFHFGFRVGRELVIGRDTTIEPSHRTCLASEGKRSGKRDWKTFCALQGLPDDFDLPGFTVAAKYQAVGNGVNSLVSHALAQAIVNRSTWSVTPQRVCACGCGQFVTGREVTAGAACRKRLERQRKAGRVTPRFVTPDMPFVGDTAGCACHVQGS